MEPKEQMKRSALHHRQMAAVEGQRAELERERGHHLEESIHLFLADEERATARDLETAASRER